LHIKHKFKRLHDTPLNTHTIMSTRAHDEHMYTRAAHTHACMYAHMQGMLTREHTCTPTNRTHTHPHTHSHTHTNTPTPTQTHTLACSHTHTHTPHTHRLTHTHTHTFEHAHACPHTRAHMHARTHVHTCATMLTVCICEGLHADLCGLTTFPEGLHGIGAHVESDEDGAAVGAQPQHSAQSCTVSLCKVSTCSMPPHVGTHTQCVITLVG
jgi:hypothetical protein